jgi:uncharacterized protein
MKILIDIGHPAHVHLFKHFAWQMQERGHEILFTVRDKENEIALLNFYKFDYRSFGKHFNSRMGKIFGMFLFDSKMIKTALKFNPDILLSHGSIYASHAGWLLRKIHIALEDTGNMEQVRLYLPFTKAVLTSEAFHRDLGKKQIRYNGFHELAYLHPKRFVGNPKIRQVIGLAENDRFFIVRFVSWNASHDKWQKGLTNDNKRELISRLAQYGKVFLSTENSIDPDFERFKINLPPYLMHDLLAEADLFIGEGATMASESAILGTPSIYINSLEAGTIDEQEKEGLLFHFRSFAGVWDKVVDLLGDSKSRYKMKIKKGEMLKSKIDVTSFLVWFVEKYPVSFQIMKENPDCQYNFR